MAPSVVPDWTAAGVLVAAIGVAGGFLTWAWKPAQKLLAWFRHDKRIAEIEAAMATKEQVEKVIADLAAHRFDDTEAFKNLAGGLNEVRTNMAKNSDLIRVENNLTQLLLDGFRHAP